MAQKPHLTPKSAKLSSAKKVYNDHHYNDGDLSFNDFLSLSQEICHYCGSKSSNTANRFKRDRKSSVFAIENGSFTYNGLDRKNNSLPHNKSNVVTCCSRCNWAKGKMSLREFKTWIRKVFRHIEKQKK